MVRIATVTRLEVGYSARSALGRHCAPSMPDLIVAATAEMAGLTVLHLDRDFEFIAEITGQPTERLALT